MIRLCLFGGVDLRGATGQELRAVLGQPKRLALLAYLAAARPRAFHSRDTLSALLWPTLDHEHARAAIRQSIYVLRRSVGNDVIVSCGDDMVGLDNARLWCDVTAFDSALDRGELAPALDLVVGEALAGFHLCDAPEFARWLDAERARLRRRAISAARKLADLEEEAGSPARALEWSRRALALAPDDEPALRHVLALLGQLGDRAEAIKMYEQFARLMAIDYEIEPMPETKALVSTLRSSGRVRLPTGAHAVDHPA